MAPTLLLLSSGAVGEVNEPVDDWDWDDDGGGSGLQHEVSPTVLGEVGSSTNSITVARPPHRPPSTPAPSTPIPMVPIDSLGRSRADL